MWCNMSAQQSFICVVFLLGTKLCSRYPLTCHLVHSAAQRQYLCPGINVYWAIKPKQESLWFLHNVQHFYTIVWNEHWSLRWLLWRLLFPKWLPFFSSRCHQSHFALSLVSLHFSPTFTHVNGERLRCNVYLRAPRGVTDCVCHLMLNYAAFP